MKLHTTESPLAGSERERLLNLQVLSFCSVAMLAEVMEQSRSNEAPAYELNLKKKNLFSPWLSLFPLNRTWFTFYSSRYFISINNSQVDVFLKSFVYFDFYTANSSRNFSQNFPHTHYYMLKEFSLARIIDKIVTLGLWNDFPPDTARYLLRFQVD